MQYRRLGKTGLMVSEIGFGGEWLERHSYEECKAAIALHCSTSRVRTYCPSCQVEPIWPWIYQCSRFPASDFVMVGYDTPEHVEQAVAYESASMEEKDYASLLAKAPRLFNIMQH